MSVALIDGDIIAYRCCTAGQQNFDWGDTGGRVSVTVNAREAREAALRMTDEWIQAAKCKDGIVAFTSGVNFRKSILPTYKAGRKDKPEAHSEVVAAIKAAFPNHEIEGLEADDVMGILATTERFVDKAVVVTIDKDLKTVPGHHFNPSTPGSAVVSVDVLHADYMWLQQTLTGDPTDNYTGLPRVGIKTVPSIIGGALKPEPLSKLWPRVVSAFCAKGYSEEFALTQARVARILRREDYDKETKSVWLWHPTTRVSLSLTPGLTSTTMEMSCGT